MEWHLDSILADLDGVDTDGVDTDAVLSALAHEERQQVLSYLATIREPASFDDLRAALDAVTVDTSGDEADRLAVRLHHVHLPKLAAADLVTYDPATGEAETTDLGREIGTAIRA